MTLLRPTPLHSAVPIDTVLRTPCFACADFFMGMRAALLQHKSKQAEAAAVAAQLQQQQQQSQPFTIAVVVPRPPQEAALPPCVALHHAACVEAAARQTVLSRLLSGYRGVLPPPEKEEVVMLSTGDIRGYDPGGLCLIGEDRRPPIKWTVGGGVAQYVLSPARLAKELRGAALRVDGKAGEAAWAAAQGLSEEVKLKLPCEEKASASAQAEDSWISFGRHSATLGVHSGYPHGEAGHLSLGQYENAHHESSSGHVPEITVQYLQFVLCVFRSLYLWPCMLVRPRCQLIRYADTVEHTDRQRGETVSAVRFFEFGRSALLVRLDMFMCVSLCLYRGVYVLPMSMHPDPERVMPQLKVYLWDAHGVARQAFLPASVLDDGDLVRVGMLECVAYGLTRGCVMCSRREDSQRPGMGAKVSEELSVLTPAECIEQAGRNPFPVFRHKWACIGWDGRWNGFYGWMLIHVFVGDGRVPRVHVYSRHFEENPTCATCKREPVRLYGEVVKVLRLQYVSK